MGELRHGLVVPEREGRWPNFGALALVVAAGGLLTGVFLAFNYAPTLEAARASVAHIQETVTLGWLLRGIHHWAGHLAIVLAAIHGARLFWHGAYKRPRRALWMIGCLIFVVLIGFAYTGYLLPGDERAYEGMGVMTSVAEATPVMGSEVAAAMRGGDAISSATMTRIYTVHIILLPVALFLLVAVFVALWMRRGPSRHYADAIEDPVAEWPGVIRRDALAAVIVMLALVALGAALQPALGPAPDPDGGAARPEWFFLWVNQLLRDVEGATFLIAGVLPPLLIVFALALPLVFVGQKRDPRARKPEILVAATILLLLGGLTVRAMITAPEEAPADEAAAQEGPATRTAAAAIMEKFKCAKCHVIDDGESEEESGPPLIRGGADIRPPFGVLYTREYFRLKVSNPRKMWPDTGMYYTPKRLKPTPEELAILEKWFFDSE